MTTKSHEDAKKRTEMLAELRKLHSQDYKEAQELLKKQQAVRKTIRLALKDGPLSVPQLAKATGLPSQEVLWYVATMKKYGLVEEVGLDDDDEYYLYGLAKEA